MTFDDTEWVDLGPEIETVNIINVQTIIQELHERRHADAELAGTNSCVDDERRALLFLKHRDLARKLQERWIRPVPKEDREG